MVTDTSLGMTCVATRSQASYLFQCPESPMSDEAPLILIIEDDPAAQAVMSRRLTASGYRVIVEGDGSTGIHRAKVEQPALVISDLHMPLAPGELVILGLRLDPATAALPILVVSADPGRLGPEHRVDGVLEKPVRVSELLAMVERLIRENSVSAPVEATPEQPSA
jgi:DNA-binding response OmpR family regulator